MVGPPGVAFGQVSQGGVAEKPNHPVAEGAPGRVGRTGGLRGALGLALLVWLGCTVIYDGILLLVVTLFRDYPLETPVLILTFLNPVELARVVLLLTFDVSILMGYTGTLFAELLGTGLGIAAAFGVLLACAAVPLVAGFQWFRKKDFER